MRKSKSARAGAPAHIQDLQPDSANRRKHTARNIGMLVDSLHRVGAARSVVIDEGNTILAGNGVIEAAAEAGITKVQIVEAEGDTIIAVRRRGLDAEQKRALAMYDNRTAELAVWDAEQIQADADAGLELEPFFTEPERKKLLGTGKREPVVKEVQTDEVADRFWISVRGPLRAQATVLQRLRELLHEVDAIEIEQGTIPSDGVWS